MYSLSSKITNEIIAATIEVYKELGFGFLESSYSRALQHELSLRKLQFETEKPVTVWYKNKNIGKYFIDLLINKDIIIELKTSTQIIRANFKQVKHYMAATKIDTGFIFNFGPKKLEWFRVFL